MNSRPTRIQLSRRRGFVLQEASLTINGLLAVKVDRTTKWGNPFITGRDGTQAECVDLYAKMLGGWLCVTQGPSLDEQKAARQYVLAHVEELRGKNLACWCRKSPCHAEVLLTLANHKREAA